MASATSTLLEIRSETGGCAGLLDCPRDSQPEPGRYLLALGRDLLPAALFPASLPAARLELAPPLPPSWLPGDRIELRGPLGRGFQLPRGVSRLALCAHRSPPALLFPLARLALERGADVAFYSAEHPAGLPSAVEILPPELLPEALPWADYLAAAFPLAALETFRRACGLRVHQPFPRPAQALVLTPMPCGGLAAAGMREGCGACSVPTPKGWKLACKDGPVFDLNLLEMP